MKLSAEDQINCIKHRIYCLNKPTIQIKALDMLADYGTQAIEAITEVISSSGIDEKVRTYGMKVIDGIKKNSTLN
jgi:hypothetical protein